jgi:hypothetical protein
VVVRIKRLEAMLGRKYIAEYTPAKFTMKTVNASEIPDTVANKIGFPSNLL